MYSDVDYRNAASARTFVAPNGVPSSQAINMPCVPEEYANPTPQASTHPITLRVYARLRPETGTRGAAAVENEWLR
jgi:hypothetical protein